MKEKWRLMGWYILTLTVLSDSSRLENSFIPCVKAYYLPHAWIWCPASGIKDIRPYFIMFPEQTTEQQWLNHNLAHQGNMETARRGKQSYLVEPCRTCALYPYRHGGVINTDAESNDPKGRSIKLDKWHFPDVGLLFPHLELTVLLKGLPNTTLVDHHGKRRYEWSFHVKW